MPFDENYMLSQERARRDRLDSLLRQDALARQERDRLKREEELATRRRRDEETNYEDSVADPLPLIANYDICAIPDSSSSAPDASSCCDTSSPDTGCF